ncbi:cobalamin synthesis [Chlorella sorokiniana]|uniref:Cobalamin synthesis n=1 Tax=Chlorella sorokiniana TaxID=3076 RepID=A0A2P6TCF5_CHLSO|nr:cobalamin synthesis [Chlorella sorokiniana]|eukprot:PRW20325.1 cobalamin synthesis [Chlorella sorokiniana]
MAVSAGPKARRSRATAASGGKSGGGKSGGKPRKGPLPVTLLSGFLGAGKTTLLQHILRNKQGLRCAVIVNDMAELNIDAGLVKQGGLIQTQERLVEMQNGCICCTLRDDLLQEVSKLARERRFDYLVIESTGIGEPQQVAETFELPPSEGAAPLRKVARLDTCVTVVDAASLLANMSSIETVADREGPEAAGGERNVADLLLDQIEFANVIVLNKIDLVAPAERPVLEAFLRRLNPGARVLPTTQAQVDLAEVIGTGRFSFEEAAQGAGWLQSLTEGHTPETEEYGIGSFVYRARRPFHPGRLWALLRRYWLLQQVDGMAAEGEEDEEMEEEGQEEEEEEAGEGQLRSAAGKRPEQAGRPMPAAGGEKDSGPAEDGSSAGITIVTEAVAAAEVAERQAALKQHFGQVLRSKGFLWLAGRDDVGGEWSQAGSVLRISANGPWFAAIPEELWPDVDPAKVRADFDPATGDRRQELVFIGIGIKKGELAAALDVCLCTEAEQAAAAELSPAGFISWPAVELVEMTDSESDGSDDSSEDDESGYKGEQDSEASSSSGSEEEEEEEVKGKAAAEGGRAVRRKVAAKRARAA